MNNRPQKPLGLILALVSSALAYSVAPLLQIVLILNVQQHFAKVGAVEGFPAYAFGGDFLGINPLGLGLQAAVSLTYLVIVVLAWRGRPPLMRWVVNGAVCGMVLLQLGALLVSLRPRAEAVASALDQTASAVNAGEFIVGLLIGLYVLWYSNRAPARAFYRGYYLPSPK